jgi:hypoxanthine-guanine phosphoribosyltransferase
LARQISLDYTDKNPMIIGILNGVFMFLSDLVREFTFHDFDIDFIKLASYQGMHMIDNS